MKCLFIIGSPKEDKNTSIIEAKQKKSQKYPVYYVNTQVNGKFGKNF